MPSPGFSAVWLLYKLPCAISQEAFKALDMEHYDDDDEGKAGSDPCPPPEATWAPAETL